MKHVLMGIDFGAKLAGTTAIAYNQEQELHLEQSRKGEDADAWLLKRIQEIHPVVVILDAPLSLPGVYQGKGSDYFYRQCDRELQAMSPMFLGGLTARAMKLNATLNHRLLEGYPSAFVRFRQGGKWIEAYKQKDQGLFLQKAPGFQSGFKCSEPQNRHQTDALICFCIALHYYRRTHFSVGDPAEGQIIY